MQKVMKASPSSTIIVVRVAWKASIAVGSPLDNGGGQPFGSLALHRQIRIVVYVFRAAETDRKGSPNPCPTLVRANLLSWQSWQRLPRRPARAAFAHACDGERYRETQMTGASHRMVPVAGSQFQAKGLDEGRAGSATCHPKNSIIRARSKRGNSTAYTRIAAEALRIAEAPT